MRSGGLLVGVATLRASGASTEDRISGGIYLSGFRIVQDAAATRHCEYRVVMPNAKHERWHRFSELKALARTLSQTGDFPEASRGAWDRVRSCKAPKGRTLDPGHLNRKCLAIERFLSSLLEEHISEDRLAELLRQVPKPRRVAPRTNNWGLAPLAYLAPTTAARVTGLKMRIR